MYDQENAAGLFVGAGAEVLIISWDYPYIDWSTITLKTETLTGLTFNPKVEAGYKWIWGIISVTPTASAGYILGSVTASDGTKISYGGSGVSYTYGIEFSLAF